MSDYFNVYENESNDNYSIKVLLNDIDLSSKPDNDLPFPDLKFDLTKPTGLPVNLYPLLPFIFVIIKVGVMLMTLSVSLFEMEELLLFLFQGMLLK